MPFAYTNSENSSSTRKDVINRLWHGINQELNGEMRTKQYNWAVKSFAALVPLLEEEIEDISWNRGKKRNNARKICLFINLVRYIKSPLCSQ